MDDIFAYCNDIFAFHLFPSLPAADIANARLVSKTWCEIYWAYRCRVLPDGMRPHQLEAMRWLMCKWDVARTNVGLTLQVNAYMSFGKTYLALKFADWVLSLEENASKYVLVIVPSLQIIRTWIVEVKKHFPAWIPRKNRITEQRFLADASAFSVDRAILQTRYNRPGKIVITTHNCSSVCNNERANCALVIYDEHHTSNARLYVNYGNSSKADSLLMGASPKIRYSKPKYLYSAYESTVGAILPKLSITNVIDNYANFKCTELALECPGKHIVVILDLEHEARYFIGKHPNTYNYLTRNQSNYNKWEAAGGYLVSSTRMIAEGANILCCSDMFCVIPDNYSMKRMQQLFGRVARIGTKYPAINITAVADNIIGHVTAIMARIDCGGYDRNRNKIAAIASKIPDLLALTDMDLMILFAESEEGASFYKGTRETSFKSIDELYEYLLPSSSQ